eukprot:15157025-Ditylum_brightwellii.AAC.1
MLWKSAKHRCTPYDSSAPIKHLFKRTDDAQDLASDARNPYQETHLIGFAYDLIFHTAVLNDACRDWQWLPDASKTWEHFKLHYVDAHTELQEMQSAAQELNYGSGIVNHANTMDTIGI